MWSLVLCAQELGDQAAAGRSLLSLATLANKEQNHSQALALLEKAQDMGGDEDFWYKLTLALLTATVTQRGQDTDTKVKTILVYSIEAPTSLCSIVSSEANIVLFNVTTLSRYRQIK